MKYYKNLLCLAFAILTLISCNTSDDESNGPLRVEITNFQPSYSQMVLDWRLSKPENIIIQGISVMRQTSEDFSYPETIDNIPSNSETYTDLDVPYYPEVSYFLSIDYRDDNQPELGMQTLESELKTFTRNIVLIKTVPYQVKQDPLNPDDFHLIDRMDQNLLKKYNAIQNSIVAEKSFDNAFSYYNRFFIRNSLLFFVNSYGHIDQLNTADYETQANYQLNVRNRVNAFSVNADRLYYIDGEVINFMTLSTGISTRLGWGFNPEEMIALNDTDILCIYDGFNSTGATIYEFTPQNCPGTSFCDPVNLAYTDGALDGNDVDANILAINSSQTQLVTGRDGNIFRMSDLSKLASLSTIAGEPYFQFAYDSQNNIYATVQGKKLIHKFKANTFELLETIETKLYPLYPLITSNGLYVIGGYSPVSYWGPYENFSFNVECAIEIF
ncbi:hypothetical protein QRD02_07665 [Aequorivita sp. SDUM287046]|uniref:Uncharacterized protein n=1 Tax=Aequorivita aurantiaca TaxID=3053356 RepID=A0ABT8DFX2_9FLAO|nr:hypothetical protein [Aequorivita aurantiaca]MDN3724256.1 hypothetical protein [Aequorivita aurantiaca]